MDKTQELIELVARLKRAKLTSEATKRTLQRMEDLLTDAPKVVGFIAQTSWRSKVAVALVGAGVTGAVAAYRTAKQNKSQKNVGMLK